LLIWIEGFACVWFFFSSTNDITSKTWIRNESKGINILHANFGIYVHVHDFKVKANLIYFAVLSLNGRNYRSGSQSKHCDNKASHLQCCCTLIIEPVVRIIDGLDCNSTVTVRGAKWDLIFLWSESVLCQQNWNLW
jgi:hypothetical protein